MNITTGRKFREELRSEAEELEARLDRVRRLISDLDDVLEPEQRLEPVPAKAGTAASSAAPSNRPLSTGAAGRTTHLPPQRGPGETRYDRIRTILRAAGGPLPTTKIVDALMQQGDKRPGATAKSFYNTVDSSLRSAEGRYFRRDGRATWALLDQKGKGRAGNRNSR